MKLEKSYWDHKFDFPCVRVAINRYRFYNDIKDHAPQGSLILYLSCRRRGSRFFWRYVNLETGEQKEVTTEGWDPVNYLKEVSMPLEKANIQLNNREAS